MCPLVLYRTAASLSVWLPCVFAQNRALGASSSVTLSVPPCKMGATTAQQHNSSNSQWTVHPHALVVCSPLRPHARHCRLDTMPTRRPHNTALTARDMRVWLSAATATYICHTQAQSKHTTLNTGLICLPTFVWRISGAAGQTGQGLVILISTDR